MDQMVFQHLQNHIETTMTMGENCAEKLVEAAEKFSRALLLGHKIFSCGIGETSLLSQIFVHYLTCGQQIERPGFPAIDLGLITNGNIEDDAYAKSLHIHGQAGDILVVFSNDNSSQLLQKTIEAAVEKGFQLLLISSTDDFILASGLGPQDIEINFAEYAKHATSAIYFLIIQCLCTLIENKIFGEN
jgi:phosphoheptose isomerase